MLMVILWTAVNVNWQPEFPMILLLIAQSFGLTGDIFLLFSDAWFLRGLGAFLLGHLVYMSLIFVDLFSLSSLDFTPTSILIAIISTGIIWGSVLWFIYRIFDKEYFFRRRRGYLFWNIVQVYIWVLSGLMALTIFRFIIGPDWTITSAMLPVGGLLFLLSDLILAYNRFVKKVPFAQLWEHVTYHLAQFSLAVGFLSIFGRL